MAQTSINVRMDETLKQQFDALCNELGLNMSTAVNIFAKTMVRQQRIPFEIGLEHPNAETLAAMAELEEMKRNPSAYKSWSDVDEMMRELLE